MHSYQSQDATAKAVEAVMNMDLPEHIARYAREIKYDPVLGTMELVTKEARMRGVAAILDFQVISLARTMRNQESFRRDGKPTLEMEFFVNDEGGKIGVYSEHMCIDQHGLTNTHIEGINHMLWQGTVYGGHKLGTPEADKTDIMAWAERGWFTRGILADIPALRGTDYIHYDDPIVTGDEIEAALTAVGITPQPGDALILYMGYEVAQATLDFDVDGPGPDFTRPGLGVTGAEWVVDNKIGLLLYDFEDAMHPSEPFAQGQLLEWAIGQGIVSGCNFGEAVKYSRTTGRYDGLLVVSPLKIPQGTGSLVNPLWIV
jgi:hypothetical protein